MRVPEKLVYTREHQWILREASSDIIRLGVTDFFQKRMEEIIYVERPPEGEVIEAGEPIFLIESGKTIYEFTSPVSGILEKINETVIDTPGLINEKPYESWLVAVSVKEASWEDFLEMEEYVAYVEDYNYPLPPFT